MRCPLALLLLALHAGACKTVYRETVDPASGAVVRELRIGSDVNVITSGDLGNQDGSGGLLGGGGGRSTVVSQQAVTAWADSPRPTIRSSADGFEFNGTISNSSPIAAAGRSATGLLAEIRKLATRLRGIGALERTQISADRAGVAKAAVDADAAVATENIAAGAAVERAAIQAAPTP